VRVLPDGAEPGTPGVVTEIVYAGALTRAVVEAIPGVTLTATLLNAGADSVQLRRDDLVVLSWEPSAVREIAS